MPIDIDLHDVALLRLDIPRTLHKHTARAATRVIECTIERLDKGGNQLHNIMGCIELDSSLVALIAKLLR